MIENYQKLAEDMSKAICMIRDSQQNQETRMRAANSLRDALVKCVSDENLNELTKIFRDKKAKNILGYDPTAIASFVCQLRIKFPSFDCYDIYHMRALEEAIINMATGRMNPPAGTKLTKMDDEWELTIQDEFIGSYRVEDGSYMTTLNDNYKLINQMVNQCPVFVNSLQWMIRGMDCDIEERHDVAEAEVRNTDIDDDEIDDDDKPIFDFQNIGHRVALMTLMIGHATGLFAVPMGVDFKRIGDTAEWYIDDVCIGKYCQREQQYNLDLLDAKMLNSFVNRRPSLVKKITHIAYRFTY